MVLIELAAVAFNGLACFLVAREIKDNGWPDTWLEQAQCGAFVLGLAASTLVAAKALLT